MRTRNCLRGRSGMIRAVSEGFSGYQLCFRENQRWNSTDSELIFLPWIFGFSALFQRKSALFSSVSEKISAETALIQRWFIALKIWCFSAVSEEISSVSEKISAETALIQRWFIALKIWCFSAVSEEISSVSEKISAETALIQRWFFCSENFQFQSCFRENQRCSALNQLCFRENQRCFSADF